MRAAEFRRRTGLTYEARGRSGWGRSYVCIDTDGHAYRARSVEYLCERVLQRRAGQGGAHTPQGANASATTMNLTGLALM
jgi:hypothetical protein